MLIIAGLAFFEGGFPGIDSPSQDAPSENSSPQDEDDDNEPSQGFPGGAVVCAWQDGNTLIELPGARTLEGCAKGLFDRLLERNLDEVEGFWQGDPLLVESDGDVYTFDEDDDEWDYEGTLEIEDEREEPPQSQPTNIPSEPSQPQQPTEPLTLEEIFVLVERDLNDYWTIQFNEADSEYFKPDIILYDNNRARTGCGTVSARMGPLYCPADHTAYFPYNFMLNQMQEVGDFAVAVIIAHEWGHAVQAMANLYPGDQTIFYELQADCFAGAYSRFANVDSSNVVLEEGDLDEGARALFLFGDPEGTPWFDEGAHGSGEQRYQAYQEGLDNGYETCLEFE